LISEAPDLDLSGKSRRQAGGERMATAAESGSAQIRPVAIGQYLKHRQPAGQYFKVDRHFRLRRALRPAANDIWPRNIHIAPQCAGLRRQRRYASAGRDAMLNVPQVKAFLHPPPASMVPDDTNEANSVLMISPPDSTVRLFPPATVPPEIVCPAETVPLIVWPGATMVTVMKCLPVSGF
jgi:hypothetical protein